MNSANAVWKRQGQSSQWFVPPATFETPRGSNILEEMDLSDLEAFLMEDVQRVTEDIAVDQQITDITSDLRLATDESTDSLAGLPPMSPGTFSCLFETHVLLF